jgi:antitoxin CptB
VPAESRLRWQCRRGMRELDELLIGYLDRRYQAADEREKSAFRKLLMLADSELIDYLLGGREAADRELADVVSRVRSRGRTA